MGKLHNQTHYIYPIEESPSHIKREDNSIDKPKSPMNSLILLDFNNIFDFTCPLLIVVTRVLTVDDLIVAEVNFFGTYDCLSTYLCRMRVM